MRFSFYAMAAIAALEAQQSFAISLNNAKYTLYKPNNDEGNAMVSDPTQPTLDLMSETETNA